MTNSGLAKTTHIYRQLSELMPFTKTVPPPSKQQKVAQSEQHNSKIKPASVASEKEALNVVWLRYIRNDTFLVLDDRLDEAACEEREGGTQLVCDLAVRPC